MGTERKDVKTEATDIPYVSLYLLRPIRSIKQALKDRKENKSQPKKGGLPTDKQGGKK